VPEPSRVAAAPDRTEAPQAAAAFWTDRNVERWQTALGLESETGLAVCDTDPLKLHYVWSLWRIGEARESDWRLELAATRTALADRQIGFADRYLVAVVDPETARRQRDADTTRRRRNFDLHVRLQPALIEWYRAMGSVFPDRVTFGLPSALPPSSPSRERRYDVQAFDAFAARLSALGSVPT